EVGLKQLLNVDADRSKSDSIQKSQKASEPLNLSKMPTLKDNLPPPINEPLVLKFFDETDGNTLGELSKNSSYVFFDLLMNTCSRKIRYQLFREGKMAPILLHLKIQELERFMQLM